MTTCFFLFVQLFFFCIQSEDNLMNCGRYTECRTAHTHSLTDMVHTFLVHLHINIFYNLSHNSVFLFASILPTSIRCGLACRCVCRSHSYFHSENWRKNVWLEFMMESRNLNQKKLRPSWMFCVPRRATDWAPFLLDGTIKATEYLVFCCDCMSPQNVYWKMLVSQTRTQTHANTISNSAQHKHTRVPTDGESTHGRYSQSTQIPNQSSEYRTPSAQSLILTSRWPERNQSHFHWFHSLSGCF